MSPSTPTRNVKFQNQPPLLEPNIASVFRCRTRKGHLSISHNIYPSFSPKLHNLSLLQWLLSTSSHFFYHSHHHHNHSLPLPNGFSAATSSLPLHTLSSITQPSPPHKVQIFSPPSFSRKVADFLFHWIQCWAQTTSFISLLFLRNWFPVWENFASGRWWWTASLWYQSCNYSSRVCLRGLHYPPCMYISCYNFALDM